MVRQDSRVGSMFKPCVSFLDTELCPEESVPTYRLIKAFPCRHTDVRFLFSYNLFHSLSLCFIDSYPTSFHLK